LFCPLHETIHFTAFKNKQLNNGVAAVLGFLLILPYQHFRAFHYAHHRFTQDPESDPELLGPRPGSRKAYFLAMTGFAVWKDCVLGLWKHAMGDVDAAFIEESKHAMIILEARCYLALYGLVMFISLVTANSAIWWYWLLPALLGQPVLRLFLIAEHYGCDESSNMLENSRTTYTSPVVNFLSWNMAYHAEHHYLASIPFHALPALHVYTGSQVKHRDDGYFNVNRNILDQLE
jgi:fatty acid desaturase